MNRAALIALAPLSGLYGLAVKTRAILYRQKLLPTHDLNVPVISVGNLTTGGTGKTPLVAWIAEQLAREERRVCVISRGYGRLKERDRVTVSDGDQVLSTFEAAGDEPLLLAERLLHKAAVVASADRVAAARWALDNLQSDVILLDDAFQNLRTARNLDIVTIDAARPWSNRWLLPAGRLREPPAALSRADVVIVTRTGDLEAGKHLAHEISHLTKAQVLFSRMVISNVRLARACGDQSSFSLPIRGMPAAAFCGIGNQNAFFTDLETENFNLVHTQAFRDHHIYNQEEIDRLVKDAQSKGAEVLLTTSKDEVKLRALKFELPCYVVEIKIEIQDEQKLLDLIEQALAVD